MRLPLFAFFSLVSFSSFASVENIFESKSKHIEIKEMSDVYVAKGVVVRGDAISDTQAFDLGFQDAKLAAFQALKNHTSNPDLPEIDTYIESVVTGFVPVKNNFENGIYSSEYEIILDKNKFASLVTKNRSLSTLNPNGKNGKIIARIIIKKDINTWIKIRNRLNESSLDYKILNLTLNEVEIMFNASNVEALSQQLKSANVEMVQNGNFYFLKLPLFS